MNTMTTIIPKHALKTGEEFKASLDDGRQLWVNGTKIAKVMDEPALAAGVELMASMFDDQFTGNMSRRRRSSTRSRASSPVVPGRCRRRRKK